MALNFRLSLTISGLLSATPRSSNRAFMAASLSNISIGAFSRGHEEKCADGRRTAKIKCLGMTYRKFKADYLFTGEGLAAPESVLITTTDGAVQGVVPFSDAGDGIECYTGLISPGFVNC